MKTAMQEFIEYLSLFSIQKDLVDNITAKATELLEKEKDQIIAARVDGFASTFIMGKPEERVLVMKGTSEDYYSKIYTNQTLKQ